MIRVVVTLIVVTLLLILLGAGYFFLVGKAGDYASNYLPDYSANDQTENYYPQTHQTSSMSITESEKEADDSLMMLESDTTSLDQGMQEDTIDLNP